MMDITTLRREFPDYHPDDLPDLSRLAAAGFTDQSWRNDLCPSVGCESVTVYLDYAMPELREFPDAQRFIVMGSGHERAFDDWQQAEAFALAECARINSDR